MKAEQVGNGRGASMHVLFSLWLCDAGFNVARGTAGNVGWAGEPGSCPVAVPVLSLLRSRRRMVIPKIICSGELERFWIGACFPSASFLSVVSCQFRLSSPWGGSCRLHDVENGCNPERCERRKLLCLTSLSFMRKKNLNGRDFVFGMVKIGTEETMDGK